MTDCIFINPPFNRYGVDYISDASLARFKMDAINPGIISMMHYLKHMQVSCKVLDFYRQENLDEALSKIKDCVNKEKPKVIAVSNLSAYDYLDALRIITFLEKEYSDIKIVIGGHHASGLREIVFQDCKELKYLIQGEGEYALYKFVKTVQEGCLNYESIGNLWYKKDNGELIKPNHFEVPFDLNIGYTTDLSIYPEAHTFTPFIEESRGCHYSCAFCNNDFFYNCNVRVKNKVIFEKDLKNAVDFYGNSPLYAILTSDLDYKTAKEKAGVIQKYGIQWSSQMDCFHDWSVFVPDFKKSGMRLMNLGLESGNPQVLQRMNKTKNPDTYLETCKKILKSCSEHGILTRVNIMIYPGETIESIKVTLKYLDTISEYLQGVVACATVAYPGSKLMESMEKFRQLYGTKLVETDFCKATHHYPIHPSESLSFEECSQIALEIEEKYSPTRILSEKHNYKKYEGVIV